MGSFYSGFGMHKTFQGTCEGGSIYLHGNHVGYYEDGVIYDANAIPLYRKELARYGGGSVYINGSHVGSYHDGIVEEPYINSHDQLGSYDGEDACAAALLTFVNCKISNDDTTSTSGIENNSSSSGDIFDLIFGIIAIVFKFIFRIIGFLFIYLFFPNFLGITWAGFLGIVLITLIPPIGMVLAPIIALLVSFFFFPYYIVLIYRRVKKIITTKEMYQWLLRWFLKGPLNYKDFFEEEAKEYHKCKEGKIITGICAGIGKKHNKNPWIFRAILIVSLLLGINFFAVLYLIGIFVLENEEDCRDNFEKIEGQK